MRSYDREHYKIKSYTHEKYVLEIYDKNIGHTSFLEDSNYEPLYKKAKEEAELGKECTIMEIKYEIKP